MYREHDLAALTGDMVSGILLVIVAAAILWAVHELAAAFHRSRAESRNRKQVSARLPEMPPPPPRPIIPGPLWQNTRVWEDVHLWSQKQHQLDSQQYTLPELRSPTSRLTQDEGEQEAERPTRRFRRGVEHRL